MTWQNHLPTARELRVIAAIVGVLPILLTALAYRVLPGGSNADRGPLTIAAFLAGVGGGLGASVVFVLVSA